MGNAKRSRLIIIKLGGSVITFKDSPAAKARKSVINRLAKELAQVYKEGYEIILVHGAGSFGHPLAKKYNLTKGLINRDSQFGFALTAQAMTNLNDLVVKILNSNSVPSVGLSPRGFITQTNGNLNPFDISPIKYLLKQNLVTVLHGDPVIDKNLGCSILSGDTIITYLANKFNVKKVIFLTDVDGIFDDDPKQNPKAKLIPEVNDNNLNQVLTGLRSGKRDDVTGEMSGKILSIKENLKRVTVVITNGLKKDVLLRVVGGDKEGTELHFD